MQIETQEHETGKERDIRYRHLLSGNDNAGIYLGYLALLILIHIHTVTTGAIPQAFQELAFSYIYTVLVLVEMNKRVGGLCIGGLFSMMKNDIRL